jgi:HK97 family phage portal protein
MAGFISTMRLAARNYFSRADGSDSAWNSSFDSSVSSASGFQINQQTALNVTAVMACVSMLSEDVAKLTPGIFKRLGDGGRERVPNHPVAKLLRCPNDWQSGFEFREMMQFSLVLRGNAYALIVRNGRGDPIKLVPINADRVAVWETPDGGLFYRVTPLGMHEMAAFKGQPFFIPAEDMLHIRGFSQNGLVGSSRINLAREAVALALGYERQAANWMGNGGRPSGVAKRLGEDWRNLHGGASNSGKVAVLEQGLKFEKISLSASDLDFIASRKFQLEEVVRIFRVPPHKVGILDRATNNNISQQSQDYVNDTIAGYTCRWTERFDFTFDLSGEGLFMDWDFSILTRADQKTRYENSRMAIMSGFLKPDEARIDDGLAPVGGFADKLIQPLNMAAAGSQATGTQPDGGGRPEGKTND